MNVEDLKLSLNQYNEQLSAVNKALGAAKDDSERESLLTLQSDLNELIQLTQENVDALSSTKPVPDVTTSQYNEHKGNNNELDDEYALFMQEMANSGAFEKDNNQDEPKCSKNDQEKDNQDKSSDDDDIEDELASLLGMKCAVYYTHKWGGQPSLYNAMVSAVIPRQEDDQFKDLKVRVLFTHPTHGEMLPCPFYLDGECKFNDEQCRYSHGTVVQLSNLKEAIEPKFHSIKVGSRVLVKLKPPDDEDISLTRKSTEKYHLWHRAVLKSIDFQKETCTAKLEHGLKTGEKRKFDCDELHVRIENIFPLDVESDQDTDSDESLSDIDYLESKIIRDNNESNRALLIDKSLYNNAPIMGEWERHTRGIGSKLMLAMGYVPGTGLGAGGGGRLQPVEARVLPVGKSLDHCMAISEKLAAQDPLKLKNKLKSLQKKEEERNKRAYEREKERERRNVFNFINKTLGGKVDESQTEPSAVNIKQSTSKDLNIEQFKISEDTRKIEREIVKLKNSLIRHSSGSSGYKNINTQILEKNKELDLLKNKEEQIIKEQKQRKDKQKMTIF